MRWPVIGLGLNLCLVGCGPSDSPAQLKPAESPLVAGHSEEILFPAMSPVMASSNEDAGLNLPAAFQQRVEDRAFLDQVGMQLHRLVANIVPGPQLYQPQTRFQPESIRMVRDTLSEDQLAYWKGLPEAFTPLRGYRAPILNGSKLWPAVLKDTSDEENRVASLLADRLAKEGLMSTLARSVDMVGADRAVKEPEAVVEELRRGGFPVDLIERFASTEQTLDATGRVRELGNKLVGGAPLESLACELAMMPFHFEKAGSDYEAADESGGMKIGMLRMQMGGGYRDGVVPGGALDIMTQLAGTLPEVNFLISVPNEFAADFRRMVRDFWPLQRPNHVTIVAEPLALAAWAQDNGKAGFLASEREAVTLVPRYATQDEISFRFLPGESLLAHGLKTAGHSVIQSSLLFQGGNLLVVRDPGRDQRFLLVGEAEVQRNRALGLTADQVLNAFRIEFGVDECVMLPPVSFHLDYDLTVRQHNGRVIVFVNDSLSAARLVLTRGVAALQQNGLLPGEEAARIREDLAASDWQRCYKGVSSVVFPLRDQSGKYPDTLVQVFAESPADSPGANFRCFLTALDLIASHAWTEKSCPGPPAYGRYLGALSRLEKGARSQRELLEEQGWTVASVPSMPDLEASVNYLNGVQDRDRYLMPVNGGFYRALDQVAIEVFRGVLGGQVNIVPIRSAGAQRRHGAIHCTAAAYPRL